MLVLACLGFLSQKVCWCQLALQPHAASTLHLAVQACHGPGPQAGSCMVPLDQQIMERQAGSPSNSIMIIPCMVNCIRPPA
jgi:hypothetical protein